MPKPSTPALLLMVVRFLRLWRRARGSGSRAFRTSPKPPTMMVAPSNTSWIASSALATTLCIAVRILIGKRLLCRPEAVSAELRATQR